MRFLLLSALALSACQADGDSTSTRDTTPVEVDRASLPDTAMVRDVSPEQTASILGDLEAASPSAAIQTLDLWSARLDTLGLEGGLADTLASLRGDLETLSGELQTSPLVGESIGTTLTEMGRKTSALANGREDVLVLGRSLSRAGRLLAPPEPTRADVSSDEE